MPAIITDLVLFVFSGETDSEFRGLPNFGRSLASLRFTAKDHRDTTSTGGKFRPPALQGNRHCERPVLATDTQSSPSFAGTYATYIMAYKTSMTISLPARQFCIRPFA